MTKKDVDAKDKRYFEGLCKMMCTKKEITATMGYTEEELDERCKRWYGASFDETIEMYNCFGKVQLRKIQLEQAKTSPQMAIWLGKQMLGQSENKNNTPMEKVTFTCNLKLDDGSGDKDA